MCAIAVSPVLDPFTALILTYSIQANTVLKIEDIFQVITINVITGFETVILSIGRYCSL